MLTKLHTEPNYPRTLGTLGASINQPDLPQLTQDFLLRHLHGDQLLDSNVISPSETLAKGLRVSVHHSVAATFFAPSDPCGVGGMHREFIRATPSWWGGPPRYDCALVAMGDPWECGINGFEVGRVRLLFSFKHNGNLYPCALVHWYGCTSDEPDEETGLWTVGPGFFESGKPHVDVIHIDALHRAAHLIAVYDDDEFVLEDLTFNESLDFFGEFYVNTYADGHMFESLQISPQTVVVVPQSP